MGSNRQVRLDRPYAIGRHEVTFEQWAACAAGGGCRTNPAPDDRGWGRGRNPVLNVSWHDANEYVAWLSRRTGRRYRLPSEAEWEHAARGGAITEYTSGGRLTADDANFNGSPGGVFRQRTLPVGSFPPNAFGLHDVHGNVSEWMEDCWSDTPEGMPSDGTANRGGDCRFRTLRGGSWSHDMAGTSFRARFRTAPGMRGPYDGFRVVRSQDP